MDSTAAATALEKEPAVCLSGGGYRAMLFHVGSLWRLHDAGLLRGITRFSSVSGGSITAAWLAMNWDQLYPAGRPAGEFVPLVVEPIRELARHTIDVSAILNPFSSTTANVAKAYRKRLFGNATLQDLPDQPVFVINATNVQSGALWRFSKKYMGDYRVGRWFAPTVELATAVGASSAFPPFLSPVAMDVDPAGVMADPGSDLCRVPFTESVVLSDGGVYDNLGLEPVQKRHETILVSDGGAAFQPEESPSTDWARHSYRILNVIDHQVRSLRSRQLVDEFQRKERQGCYWGINTDVSEYTPLSGIGLRCPLANTQELAATPTRLAELDDVRQEQLINWGYAVCDAALRKYHVPALPVVATFPYDAVGV